MLECDPNQAFLDDIVKGKETETEEAAQLTPPRAALSGEYYHCTY
jgi:hypothetical protein